MALTRLTGTLIKTGSIPTWALTGGVVSASAAGYVGIGTSSPAGPLHIYGTLGNTGEVRLESSNGRAFSIGSTGTAYGSSNNLIIYDIAAAMERVRINSSGNFGINNNNPSASLHVSGATMIEQIIEKVNVTASAPPATYNVDLTSGSIFFRSASTSANWTMNFRGNAGTNLNDIIYPGQSITATILTINGATAYSASAYQIDGRSITPRWLGGVSGSANSGSLDAHQFTIIKIASASYQVLASINRYS